MSITVDGTKEEYQRLMELGLIFIKKPTKESGAIVVVLDNIYGNIIQIYQES